MAGNILAFNPCEDGLINLAVTFNAGNTGISGYNVWLDGELTADSPYPYAMDGNNSFEIEVAGDGASHTLLIADIDMPDCMVEYVFVASDCDDPCFGFDANYDVDIDHSSLMANFVSTTETAVTWHWDFGDGITSMEENTTHTYAAEGEYEVCLIVTDGEACTDTICNTIFIGAYLCEAAFSYEGEGLGIQFTDESVTTETITNWSWKLADGTLLSEEQHPLIIFDTLGIYEICLTIEAGDCRKDTCMMLDLSDPCLVFVPDFSFVIDTNTLSVQFTDLSTGDPNQWLWGFGDGNTSNDQHPLHFYESPGNYNVCLLVQDTELGCNEAFCQILDIGITGIFEPKPVNRSLNIYPNPSEQGRLSWTVEGIQEKDFQQLLGVKIYDASGKTILNNRSVGAESMSVRVEMPLSAGVYFLEMRSNYTVYRAKLIIQ